VPTRLQALYARRAAERRAEAVPRATAALEALAVRGVDAGVIGSLVRDRMRDYSDIDFLILDTAGLSWNEIVKTVEDKVRRLPIDVIFWKNIPDDERPFFLKDLKRADQLRALLATT
jgi:predicted nucleotidyltransferase